MNQAFKDIIANRKEPNCFDRFVWGVQSLCNRIRCYLFGHYDTIRIPSLGWGHYADADTRLFHGAFDLMVEFVEGELAWMELVLPEQGDEVKVPWWQTKKAYCKAHAEELANRYFRWATQYKEVIDGIEYGHPKADAHKELRELYIWWKHLRPTRPDPTDIWVEGGYTDESFKKSRDIEAAQEEEDTTNFIRLVKIRDCMWT